jgi:hypothetical protein
VFDRVSYGEYQQRYKADNLRKTTRPLMANPFSDNAIARKYANENEITFETDLQDIRFVAFDIETYHEHDWMHVPQRDDPSAHIAMLCISEQYRGRTRFICLLMQQY